MVETRETDSKAVKEVLTMLAQWKAYFGSIPPILLTDNAKEYCDESLNVYLAEGGTTY